ncbi:ChaN family lipoprotein [Microcoleus sp. FACHB-672]|uniref:ChaN family lipoprotein n=1 Tax=Microcoleus sp. FACHB-672 TaxID=2692825 RepID=UPI0016879C0A|nr:ChaN family lipoprotein [Microcoleus sp. FACHB-672]MBD2040931.1 ChaN family lipoprotein [Microcoleus sp. FACHB-672]
MKISQISKLFAWSLGLVLLYTGTACAQRISSPLQESHSRQEVLQELSKANVVYLGETHDSAEDHKAQLEILKELHRQNPKIAIAMEMFQRPYQNIIDKYLAGKLTETELVEKSEYEKRWGFPWEYYAPMLQFAKENKLPVLALNTPSELTRKVVREGLEGLTETDRQYIPTASEIDLSNKEYRQMVLDSFKQHQQAGHGSSADFERFFLAQVLWDETMADVIAQFLKQNLGYQVVVLAGQGHVIYGYGIPSRVERRMTGVAGKSFQQRLILLNSNSDFPVVSDKPVADFFWKSE